MNPSKTVLAASIGDCVHVAGILAFLDIARECGYEAIFLGPATPVEHLMRKARETKPAIIAVSYRLSPPALEPLLEELKEGVRQTDIKGTRFFFGGTPATCEVSRKAGIFEAIFAGGESPAMIRRVLTGDHAIQESPEDHKGTLVERIAAREPFPLIRHHFGLPTVKETAAGAREIAMSGVLDVLSLGPDQNAQEHFFHPEEMDPGQDGAGGVPLRSMDDLRRIYEATRCGNFPRLRCYSGTRDIIKMGQVLLDTIHNAWAAIPLFWYNVLDGRSKRPLVDAIRENQEAIQWHARQGIPVEVNEAHHWSLRQAPDAVAVACAFLAAYNAKKAGVRYYVAQYMLNTPPATSPRMDLAKMLAKIELIESLHDGGFTSFRQVRGGLASMSRDMDFAKGQIAASTFLGMLLSPHIVHVVGYPEAQDVARPAEIIESCKIAQGTIHNCIEGIPDVSRDPAIMERKEELLREARGILDAIREVADSAVTDPWLDPGTLAKAVKMGILDAPHLTGNSNACGEITTRMIGGACRSYDPSTGKPLSECQRIRRIMTGESRS